MEGTITAIRASFGFIRGDDGHDRFFHHGSFDKKVNSTPFKDLEEGMRVSFESYALTEPPEGRATDPTKQHNNLRARRVVVLS